MDDEIERDDEDFSYDYLIERIADEHGDEITRNRQTSNVAAAALEAHYPSISAAEEQLKKARQRLAESVWDEAVFHAGRALDGYATEVFINPFRSLALVPFQEAFSHVKISDNAIFSEVNGLESGAKFVFIGIAATAGRDEATNLIGEIRALLKDPKPDNPITWNIRNTTLHSMTDPSPEEAARFVTRIEELLDRLSDPLKRMAIAAEAAAPEGRPKSVDSRAYKSFGE